MRVLRLGNSEDTSPGIPDEARAWYFAGKRLEEVSGEPVETVLRPIWPGRELPALLDGWLDDHQPDVVFIKVTWFWYAYESVPRRIERLLGRAGKPIAKAGLGAAKKPRLARNRAFKLGRRMAHRVIGGDTPFDSSQVLEVMEACIRKVIARENIVLVVKGTGGAKQDVEALAGFYGRFTTRRLEVEGGIERLCKSLHVTYVGVPPRPPGEKQDLKGGDGLHQGQSGQQRMGMIEGAALADAWLAAHPSPLAATTAP